MADGHEIYDAAVRERIETSANLLAAEQRLDHLERELRPMADTAADPVWTELSELRLDLAREIHARMEDTNRLLSHIVRLLGLVLRLDEPDQ